MLELVPSKDVFVRALLERLEARIESTGESERQFAARVGSSDGLFKNLRSGSMPTVDRLDVLLRELGQSLTLGTPQSVRHVTDIAVGGDEYAHIPLHDAELAAGDGASNSGDVVIEALAFRRDWLKRIGVAASAARLVRVAGDSMEPTLRSGDMVMVDTARRDIPVRRRSEKDLRPAPIYALLDQGDARVKRVERPTVEHFMLISDNRAAELRPAADIELLGRVVWWGHTVRE